MWLGAIASVLLLALLVCWLLDKTVSAVLRTIGWLGPVVRFMRLDHQEKLRLKAEHERAQRESER
jgi:hypothetical protein